MYECCLCGRRLGSNALIYWCNKCYAKWKQAILDHQEWTVYLVNLESKRRRDEHRDGVLIFLGSNDIAEINGKYRVIRNYIEGGEDYG